MNVERLRQLANLLRADAINPTGVKFDLGVWASPCASIAQGFEFDDTVDLSNWREMKGPETKKIEMSCNTFACALGLAALDPEFQKQGLSYTFLPTHRDNHQGTMMPIYAGQTGWDGGALFFDISTADARYFFDPECYDGTPRHAEGELFVAERIENFIEGKIDRELHPAFYDDDDGDDDYDND